MKVRYILSLWVAALFFAGFTYMAPSTSAIEFLFLATSISLFVGAIAISFNNIQIRGHKWEF